MAASNSRPKSVLFVCTGNTCRSPMAQGLLEAAIEDGDRISVSSAGIAAMPGQSASRETLSVLKSREASLDGFKSRQVDEKVLGKADLIIAMTCSHADVIRRHFPKQADAVSLLSDYIDSEEGLEGGDVPDPIGMGADAYEEVAEVIDLAIPGIIRHIKTAS